jgi:MoaA/NifB/PqqE/SkfB family radical SAM enzyme
MKNTQRPAGRLPLLPVAPPQDIVPRDTAAAPASTSAAAPDVGALLAGSTFCIKPWVHCHVNTRGQVQACCVSPLRYGDLGTESLDDIWQGNAIRRFRAAHLSGQKVRGCERCYEAEKVGAFSMRKNANEYFGERARAWVESTTAAGEAPQARPIDYDIRFSNICNFKCRSCFHGSSSAWYKDHIALHGAPNGPKAILRAFETASDFWAAFGQFVDDVEKVYFAGGEPLLQDEQYEVLRALHERGKHDVFIFYNTNFSALDYRGTSVTELWRHFRNLTVAASLDASGARAELIRHGQSWSRTLEHRERLRRDCPQVAFRVGCTVSALNVWHLPDFHRELIETGFVEADAFDINLCQYPPQLSVQVLPAQLKREVDQRIVAHMERLRQQGHEDAAERFLPVRDYLWAADASERLPHLQAFCAKLDGLRGEATLEVLPELASALGATAPVAAE